MNTIGFNTKRGKCFALVAVFAMVACAFTVALAEENTAQTMVEENTAYVPIGKVPIAKDPSNRDLSTGTALDAYVPIGKVYPVATTIPTAVASTHVAIVDFN